MAIWSTTLMATWTRKLLLDDQNRQHTPCWLLQFHRTVFLERSCWYHWIVNSWLDWWGTFCFNGWKLDTNANNWIKVSSCLFVLSKEGQHANTWYAGLQIKWTIYNSVKRPLCGTSIQIIQFANCNSKKRQCIKNTNSHSIKRVFMRDFNSDNPTVILLKT